VYENVRVLGFSLAEHAGTAIIVTAAATAGTTHTTDVDRKHRRRAGLSHTIVRLTSVRCPSVREMGMFEWCRLQVVQQPA
jgi:hypothetical protein